MAVIGWREDGPLLVPGSVSYRFNSGGDGSEQWRVSVATPPPSLQAMTGDEGPWPTVYVLDAPITFVVAAQTAQTTAAFSLGQLRPVAVVGIGPASDDLGEMVARRTRDLTPIPVVPGHLAGSTPLGTGGAEAMLDLIQHEIAPRLEACHPLDPADRGLAGTSLGGLFTCWALLTRPSAFQHYLAVSPSLYWDEHLLLDEQRAPTDLVRAVAPGLRAYLAVGEREEDPAKGWPVVPAQMLEAMAGIRMVTEARALVERLQGAGVRVGVDVIPDENHATIWPSAVTRGLVHLYSKAGA